MVRISLIATAEVAADAISKDLRNQVRPSKHKCKRKPLLKFLQAMFNELYLPRTPCKFGPFYIYNWEFTRVNKLTIAESRSKDEVALDAQLWNNLEDIFNKGDGSILK